MFTKGAACGVCLQNMAKIQWWLCCVLFIIWKWYRRGFNAIAYIPWLFNSFSRCPDVSTSDKVFFLQSLALCYHSVVLDLHHFAEFVYKGIAAIQAWVCQTQRAETEVLVEYHFSFFASIVPFGLDARATVNFRDSRIDRIFDRCCTCLLSQMSSSALFTKALCLADRAKLRSAGDLGGTFSGCWVQAWCAAV